MENFSIMKILSMLGGGAGGSPETSAETKESRNEAPPQTETAQAEKGGAGNDLLGNIGSALSQGGLGSLLNLFGGKNALPQKEQAPQTAPERIKIDANPLISAMKSHDDFIKRVNKKK